MAERFKALVSKTSGVFLALVGSNPTPSAIDLKLSFSADAQKCSKYRGCAYRPNDATAAGGTQK